MITKLITCHVIWNLNYRMLFSKTQKAKPYECDLIFCLKHGFELLKTPFKRRLLGTKDVRSGIISSGNVSPFSYFLPPLLQLPGSWRRGGRGGGYPTPSPPLPPLLQLLGVGVGVGDPPPLPPLLQLLGVGVGVGDSPPLTSTSHAAPASIATHGLGR